MHAERYRAVTYAQRPDLIAQAAQFNNVGWPPFMCQDPNEQRYWHLLETLFPGVQVMLCQAEEVVAVGHAAPLFWDGTVKGLPDGWGAALAQSVSDARRGRATNCACALSVVIHSAFRRQGLSRLVLAAMGQAVRTQGLDDLIAPVRPSLKETYPHVPIDEYLRWHRSDGSPFDPWVRVHWRLGGKILAPAPTSMTITGSVAEWTAWTGMPFPVSADYLVPGALQPVRIDVTEDVGCYQDPNVWMHHALTASSAVR